jgi:hypothetical protein
LQRYEFARNFLTKPDKNRKIGMPMEEGSSVDDNFSSSANSGGAPSCACALPMLSRSGFHRYVLPESQRITPEFLTPSWGQAGGNQLIFNSSVVDNTGIHLWR